MKLPSGFSMIEMVVGLALTSVLIFLSIEVSNRANQDQNKATGAGNSVANLSIPIFTLKKDIRRATAIIEVAGPDPSIQISQEIYDSATKSILLKTIVYTVVTEPCPEFGANEQCKALTRTDGAATQTFRGIADLNWCLRDPSVVTPPPNPFKECTQLPFVLNLPPPKSNKRFAMTIARRSGLDNQTKIYQNLIVDLENIQLTSLATNLKVIRTQ